MRDVHGTMGGRGTMTGHGSLGLSVIRRNHPRPSTPMALQQIIREAWPSRDLPESLRRWRAHNLLKHFIRGLRPWLLARISGALIMQPSLYLVKYGADGEELDYGLVSLRVITDAGVGFLVDAWQNSVELENMKFHALGTGVGAEAVGNTALGTEWTSAEYAARATGSTTEGGTAATFRTVGTNTKLNAGTSAVTEHGVFSSATIGSGVLWDRSVFAAINLSQNDSLQSTYDMVASSGG